MAEHGNWNDTDLAHRCGLDKQPRVANSETRRRIARDMNDQIDDFFKRGGKIEKLPSCTCSTDQSYNHPARLHNRTTV